MGLLFKKMGKPKKDKAASKAKYTAYRRKMSRSPATITKTLSYSQWKKKQK